MDPSGAFASAFKLMLRLARAHVRSTDHRSGLPGAHLAQHWHRCSAECPGRAHARQRAPLVVDRVAALHTRKMGCFIAPPARPPARHKQLPRYAPPRLGPAPPSSPAARANGRPTGTSYEGEWVQGLFLRGCLGDHSVRRRVGVDHHASDTAHRGLPRAVHTLSVLTNKWAPGGAGGRCDPDHLCMKVVERDSLRACVASESIRGALVADGRGLVAELELP